MSPSRPSVAIVGAGFGGIAAAIALKQAGYDRITVYEQAAELGGVWHHNTYPGAACDVPSYLYSFSYRQRRDWSRPCSPQAEIADYLRECADHYGITPSMRFSTTIARTTWDDAQLRWTLTTDDGTEHHADAIILACGQLSRPAFPKIPGIERFRGDSFHSARWDHDCDLAGRRVAVIGTGASAIQFVPPVAEQAQRLHVFQRQAPYLLPRRNREYGPVVRRLIARMPGLQSARRRSMWLVMEFFITALTRIRPLSWLLRGWSWWHMRRQTPDPELRRKTTPDYPFGCKRILFSSAYLPALMRRNVELVTTGIREITEDGIVTTDGQTREVDAIVYGTGFESHAFVAPMQVTGTGGRDLQETWRDGARAHLGITVSGFPNMFLMYGPNTNLGVGSIVAMLEAQAHYVTRAIGVLRRDGVRALDVRAAVASAFDARTQQRLQDSVWTTCSSWYQDASGRVVNNWPGYMTEYVRATRDVDLDAFELLRAPEREDEPTAVAGG